MPDKKFTDLDNNTLFATHANAIYSAVFPHVQSGVPMTVDFADMKAAVLSYPSPSLSASFTRLGYQAGNVVTDASVGVTATGGQAGLGNTTGSNNTYNGAGAGVTNVTGDGNTCIGSDADVTGAAQSNVTVIGYGARGLGSNTTVLGKAATTRTHAFGVSSQPAYTVAGLATAAPAASVPYARSFVTDSSVAVSGNFGAIVAGSGANVVPVFSDGVDWRIG